MTISQAPSLPLSVQTDSCQAVINNNHKKHKSVQILKNATRANTPLLNSLPNS